MTNCSCGAKLYHADDYIRHEPCLAAYMARDNLLSQIAVWLTAKSDDEWQNKPALIKELVAKFER
jgi:hypothetical protein